MSGTDHTKKKRMQRQRVFNTCSRWKGDRCSISSEGQAHIFNACRRSSRALNNSRSLLLVAPTVDQRQPKTTPVTRQRLSLRGTASGSRDHPTPIIEFHLHIPIPLCSCIHSLSLAVASFSTANQMLIIAFHRNQLTSSPRYSSQVFHSYLPCLVSGCIPRHWNRSRLVPIALETQTRIGFAPEC